MLQSQLSEVKYSAAHQRSESSISNPFVWKIVALSYFVSMINKQPDLLTQEHCCDDGESRVGNLDHNWQSLTTETQACPAEPRGGGYNEGDHYQV